MKPRASGYCRVSTVGQFDSGLSINEQRDKIKKFCEAQGFDLGRNDARLGEEPASAYKMDFIDRPLGKALHANLVAGDHIVIAKLDRAFRNLRDTVVTVNAWVDRGIIVHILDLPLSGQPIFDKLMLSLLAWVAEFESFRKSERMLDVNRAARRLGKPITSCAPLCFKWAANRSKLAYFPEEREHCALCFELYTEQELSLWQIASYLMSQKVKPYDKRSPERRAKGKQKVAKDYHPEIISRMIHLEAELRYYEAEGRTPEEASVEWLKDWGLDKLPERGRLQEAVNDEFKNVTKRTKGEPCVQTS